MEMKDVTIIIPTRTDVGHLSLIINSIRSKEQYNDCTILIGADTPPPEIQHWLKENGDKLNFIFLLFLDQEKPRLGICPIVEELVKRVETEYIFYCHDDMVVGNKTIEVLMNRWEPKTILSSLRVEPPIYPKSSEKILAPLGFDPTSFDNEKFLELEQNIISQMSRKEVEGFFAPHFFKKTDWIGYDPIFYPQSREDSELALRFLEKGYKLITLWNSVVYHFSGKGSRRKNGVENDEEWVKTNNKNQKNYVRKWGTLAHTEYILPIKAPNIPISAHILVGNDSELLYNFINHIEEYFDELVFVIDTDQSEEVQHDNLAEIERYVADQENDQPTNFRKEKVRVFFHKLNGDFAAQTNFAISKCSNDWVMKLDVDEVFPTQLLNKLRFILSDVMTKNPNITIIGFPRINSLDGKTSNDIPREHWFTKEFDNYPQTVSEIKNTDPQFRLTRHEQWVGPVHEVPESLANRDLERVATVQDGVFFHPKNREKQRKQEELYAKIVGTKKTPQTITKYFYDSVIYTIEGITEHARQEVKELKKRGKQVFLMDGNYKKEFGEYLKDCYDPIDVKNDEYVTIINQPPPRWPKSYGYKNLVGYLAFEGELNDEWVKIINESPIKELWTPSNYCKKMFTKSGVTKPIWVIPHGVDPDLWVSKKVDDEEFLKLKENGEFVFLASGTYQNNRKGFDLLARAFSEEFGPDEKVKLVFKINKIYNPNDNFSRYIKQFVNQTGNTRIEYVDKDLSPERLVDLYNSVDVFVSPHRAEGFGINILNALAIGLPVITTGATGNMDFCNKDNCLLIDVGANPVWSDFIPPYENSKWEKPSIDSLKRNLRKTYNDYGFFKKRAEKVKKQIRKEWTWKDTVDKIEERVKTLFC